MLGRFSEVYDTERRILLQQYLQKLFSTHKKILLHKSRVLKAFIRFDDRHKLCFEKKVDGDDCELDSKWGNTDSFDGKANGPEGSRRNGLSQLLTSVRKVISCDEMSDVVDESTCSENSDDSGFGENDVHYMLKVPDVKVGAQTSRSLQGDSVTVSTAYKEPLPVPSSDDASAKKKSRCDDVNDNNADAFAIWSLVGFLWDLCKSDFWIFIVAGLVLLLNSYGLIPDLK